MVAQGQTHWTLVQCEVLTLSQLFLNECWSGGMADALDSKSSDRKVMRVQLPPPAVFQKNILSP